MSWQVKDTTSEINRLRNDLNKIRDQLFISSFSTGSPSASIIGGATGQGTPIGGGNQVGLMALQPDDNVTITDVDTTGTATGVFDKINLSTSNMVIKTGSGSNDIKFIQGTLNNGQFIILKAEIGVSKTLKTGGNINIATDVTFTDQEVIIAIFYEEQTSPDSNGSYVIHKLGAVGAGGFYQTIQDEGVGVTQRPIFNFIGAGVVATDDAGNNRTNVTITAGNQTPWLSPIDADDFTLFDVKAIGFFSTAGAVGFQSTGGPTRPDIEYEAIGAHDFFVNRAVTIIPRMGLTTTGLFMNVPIVMSNPGSRDIFMGVTGDIRDLQDINDMRDLFFDTTGTPFAITNGGQIFGRTSELGLNAPSPGLINLYFGGILQWQFDETSLTGSGSMNLILNNDLLFNNGLVDPFVNGQMNRNGADVKVFSGGAVRNLSNIGTGGGANTFLSNLTSPTAINQDLLPDGDFTRDLGVFVLSALFVTTTGAPNTGIAGDLIPDFAGTHDLGSGSRPFAFVNANSGVFSTVNATVAITLDTATMFCLGACFFNIDTVTGLKIGTGTTQKIGFWNSTPLVQQTVASDTLANLYTLLRNIGIVG